MLSAAARWLFLLLASVGCVSARGSQTSERTSSAQLSVFVFNYSGSEQPLRVLIEGEVVFNEQIGRTATHGLVNTIQAQVPLRLLRVHIVDVRTNTVYRARIQARNEPQFCQVDVLETGLRLRCAHGVLALM